MFWKISWRNFKRKPLRNFLTLLGITVGVVSLLAVTSSVATTNRLINEQVQETLGTTDFTIQSTEGNFPKQVLKEVEEVSGVEKALGLTHLSAEVDIPGKNEADLPVRLTGLSKMDSSLVPLKVIQGSPNSSGLFLSNATARLWSVKPGDSVSLKIDGKKHTVPVAAVVRDTMFLKYPVSGNEAAARNRHAAALPIDLLEKLSGKKGVLQEVRIQTMESGKDQSMKEIESRMHHKGYPVYIEAAIADPRQKNRLDELYLFLLVLGGTALLISCMILFQTFYTNIAEREREFAIMKSFGSTPDQIRGIVLREALILSSVGTLLGILPGIWMAVTLQKGIFRSFHVDFDYEIQLGTALPVTVALGIILPVIASLLPVSRASRISVIQLQKMEKDALSRPSKWRILFGGALLGISLFDHDWSYLPAILGAFILIPFAFRGVQRLMWKFLRNRVESEVALRNAIRQGRRHSNMAAVLMLGIALSLLMTSFFNYQDNYLERDMASTFGGHLQFRAENPFTKQEIDAIREEKGVKDTTRLGEASVIWGSGGEQRRMNVLGVDPEWQHSHPLYTLQRGEEKATDLSAKGTILLGDYAFQQWGGEIGEMIRLKTPGGEEKFRVTGVVRTGFDSSYVGFVGKERMKEEFGVAKEVRGLLALHDQQDQEKMKETLLRNMGNRLVEVRTLDEEIKWQRRYFPGLSFLFAGLLAVALGTVGIGIVNLLLMSVTERLSEYKTMRAIGAGRSQVFGMVIGEGAVIGVTGILVGSLLGFWLIGLNAISDLVDMEFIIPWTEWVMICLSGALVTFVATSIPAARAAFVSMPPVSSD
ncbi:peptide ABC superfamily ATP binding cassette transporter permease [Desmospora sp. 8437]|nr:peptide ABC superfamily ATP binding cassette transporter permease [Desmospora sp. 8437]